MANEDFQEFLYFCCPNCDARYKTKVDFSHHRNLCDHQQSVRNQVLKLQKQQQVLETKLEKLNQTVENVKFKQELVLDPAQNFFQSFKDVCGHLITELLPLKPTSPAPETIHEEQMEKIHNKMEKMQQKLQRRNSMSNFSRSPLTRQHSLRRVIKPDDAFQNKMKD